MKSAGAKIWGSEDTTGVTWWPIKVDSEGRIVLAGHLLSTTAPTNTGVNVGVASTAILVANTDRGYAAIVNDSDTTIYLALGAAAVLNQGIRLNARGGTFEIAWGNLWRGTVNGIHGGAGNKVVTVTEVDIA